MSLSFYIVSVEVLDSCVVLIFTSQGYLVAHLRLLFLYHNNGPYKGIIILLYILYIVWSFLTHRFYGGERKYLMSNSGSSAKPTYDFLLCRITIFYYKDLLVGFVSLLQYIWSPYVHKGLWSCRGNVFMNYSMWIINSVKYASSHYL